MKKTAQNYRYIVIAAAYLAVTFAVFYLLLQYMNREQFDYFMVYDNVGNYNFVYRLSSRGGAEFQFWFRGSDRSVTIYDGKVYSAEPDAEKQNIGIYEISGQDERKMLANFRLPDKYTGPMFDRVERVEVTEKYIIFFAHISWEKVRIGELNQVCDFLGIISRKDWQIKYVEEDHVDTKLTTLLTELSAVAGEFLYYRNSSTGRLNRYALDTGEIEELTDFEIPFCGNIKADPINGSICFLRITPTKRIKREMCGCVYIQTEKLSNIMKFTRWSM